MEKLNQQIKLLFWFSLGLSIGLPAGILGIVFGAVKGIVFLLVLGILLTVGGFYVMPLLWIKYGERRADRSLLFIIESEHLDTVTDLAAQTGRKEADVRAALSRMINGHMLVGYLFRNDVLIPNEKKKDKTGLTRKCECCGALMIYDQNKFLCEYCGNTAAE